MPTFSTVTRITALSTIISCDLEMQCLTNFCAKLRNNFLCNNFVCFVSVINMEGKLFSKGDEKPIVSQNGTVNFQNLWSLLMQLLILTYSRSKILS